MPKTCYVEKNFSASSMAVIEHANRIITEYEKQGFTLTLRQLYYQFVSRDLIRNNQREYKRLGSIINDARLAGLIDWDAIEDRTRSLKGNSHWKSPSDIVDAAASGYRIDKWADQPYRVEVWIEKDALVGVIEGVCAGLDIDYFSCRGYTSQSECWRAGRRLRRYVKAKQKPMILHFGDHDPSGIDMTRDITDRLELFMGGLEVERLALNMDQIQKFKPPPNPAKTTDSRYRMYIAEHGPESWELDALEPRVIERLITRAVLEVRDQKRWDAALALEASQRARLQHAAEDLKRDLDVEGTAGDEPEDPE